MNNVSNRPSKVPHVVFSSLVSISKNCRPFLPNQFLTIANCSMCGVLYMDRILFTSNLKVLSLLVLIFHFPVECGLLHGRATYLGSCHCLWPIDCCCCCHGFRVPLLLLQPLPWLWSHSLYFVCLPLFSFVSA